jgi:hypothetical protein
VLTAGVQLHEQVVAQQVGLTELQAGVVEGLEDAVHVVAALGGHRTSVSRKVMACSSGRAGPDRKARRM